MKDYSWEEVIKMLSENKNLVFEENNGDSILKQDSLGIIRFYKDGKNVEKYGLRLNSTFKLVQEPVSFMDAIKVYSEGKTIYCKCRGITSVFIPEFSEENDNDWNFIYDADNFAITSYEILNGEWYIEED